MATFIEIQTDAFANNISALAAKKRDFSGVRRPFRGIEIKEDTYSVIKVIRADGSEIPLTDSGGGRDQQSGGQTAAGSGVPGQSQKQPKATTYNYANYIIQSVQDTRTEKAQILETFGDTFVFFFGERPRVLSISGLLLNTRDFNWRTEFWYNYENVLRGTKLVEQNARVYLFWDDILVEGYIMNATAQETAEMPYHIPFQFNLFVTNHTYLSAVGDDAYPITHAVAIQPLQAQQAAQSSAPGLKSVPVATQQQLTASGGVRTQAEGAGLGFDDLGDVSFSQDSLRLPKATLQDALRNGVVEQNLSFLGVADNYFRQRKMRIPRGAAGSDTYAGPPMYANRPNPFSETGRRTKPLRSKIRDNVDEYIGGGGANNRGWGSTDDSDKALQAQMDQQNKTRYEAEKKIQQDLDDIDADPINHPVGDVSGTDAGNSAWLNDHDNQVFSDDPPDIVPFNEPF